MSEKNATIDLTLEQVSQLWELADKLRRASGNDMQNPNTLFGKYLSIYLTALGIDAESESSEAKKEATKIRRDLMLAFKSYFGRQATSDDLLQRLSLAIGKVDDTIAEAIRRDVERLKS